MLYHGVLGLVNVFFNYLTPNRITCVDLREDWQDWFCWFNEKKINNAQWLESDQSRYESAVQLAAQLQLSVNIVTKTVANTLGDVAYYRTSLSQEDGLVSPDKLQKIWKNIFIKSTEQRQAVTLNQVVDLSVNKQWLIIDSLNGIMLLKESSIDLDIVDLIVVRTLSPQIDASFSDLKEHLEQKDFLLLEMCSTEDSAIVRAVFIKDLAKKLTLTETRYKKLEANYQDLLDQHQDSQVEQHELLQNIDTLEGKIASYISLETASKKLAKKLKKKIKKLDELQLKYEALQQSYDQLSTSEEKMNILLNRLTSFEENIDGNARKIDLQHQEMMDSLDVQKNAFSMLQTFNDKNALTTAYFSKNLTNVVAQIENYIALNNYFNTGSKLSNYHGWPISPDIALFIVDVINEKNYDAIIEFGSGTSTELFAKIALMRKKKNQKVPKILTFDHLSEYYEKTQAILSRESLGDFVQLECAPLIPMRLQDDDYQYYDCEQILKEFLADLPIDAKILVLVDGPPGATCKHARYPALPMIYKVLTQNNQLDFVMDDAARLEEKEVVDKWKVYLDQNEYSYLESIPRVCEKGLVLLSVFRD